MESRVMQFEPGDQVEVIQGSNAGAIGVVVRMNQEGKVVVRSEVKGTERSFKPAWLTRLDSGEHSSQPPAHQNGNSVPQPTEQLRELCSPEFEDHPFPINGNHVPHTKAATGNHVPQPIEIKRLEQLIQWQAELSQKDTIRDRWIYEEATDARTRYRLRWRKDGKLFSQELSQDEFEAMRDRIHYGQQLTHINALIKLLVAELLPGHDDKARERRAAIERMIDTRQPFASIVAVIAGLTTL